MAKESSLSFGENTDIIREIDSFFSIVKSSNGQEGLSDNDPVVLAGVIRLLHHELTGQIHYLQRQISKNNLRFINHINQSGKEAHG